MDLRSKKPQPIKHNKDNMQHGKQRPHSRAWFIPQSFAFQFGIYAIIIFNTGYSARRSAPNGPVHRRKQQEPNTAQRDPLRHQENDCVREDPLHHTEWLRSSPKIAWMEKLQRHRSTWFFGAVSSMFSTESWVREAACIYAFPNRNCEVCERTNMSRAPCRAPALKYPVQKTLVT